MQMLEVEKNTLNHIRDGSGQSAWEGGMSDWVWIGLTSCSRSCRLFPGPKPDRSGNECPLNLRLP